METVPLVSVIVPCFNQAQYLPDALDSVLNQTYRNWECIVVDDGSPDNTPAVAREYAQRDGRILYVSKTNGGLSDARNFGVRHSKGFFVLPLDADDRIGPDYLTLAVNEFNENPSAMVVYPGASYFGDRDGIRDVHYKGYSHLLLTNHIVCSALYRRSDFDRINGYDTSMRTGLEDWEFWIRMLAEDSVVRELPGIHFFYRVKHTSMVKQLAGSKDKKATAINYVVCKHIDKYSRAFGDITHYIGEHQVYKAVETKVRSRFVSKALFYLSRRLVGLR